MTVYGSICSETEWNDVPLPAFPTEHRVCAIRTFPGSSHFIPDMKESPVSSLEIFVLSRSCSQGILFFVTGIRYSFQWFRRSESSERFRKSCADT